MEEYNNVQRLGASRNDMYWIIYQTINLVNDKIYIGVHKTKDPYTFDGYLGCGVYNTKPASYMYGKTTFELAVKKYGPNNFKRIVLQIYNNEEDAYNEEARLVNEDFLKRSDVYNMILGGKIPYIKKDGIKVYQYDLEGNYVASFESFLEGGKSIGVNKGTISDSVSHKLSSGGYYWSTEKVDKLDLKEFHSTKIYKPVYKYDINGNFLEELKSTNKSGYSYAHQAAILGHLVDKKYYFCYVKDSSYSKARDSYIKTRSIFQYNKNGVFLKEWNYLNALKEFPHDGINQCIRNKKLSKSGFFWGLQQYPIYNQPTKKVQQKIGKYTLDGELIKEYKNSSECYKENGKGVYKAVVGLRKTYKGFIYKYIS